MTDENKIIEGDLVEATTVAGTEDLTEIASEIGDITDLVLIVNAQVVESNFAHVAQQIKAQISQISEKLETEEEFLNATKVAKNLRAAKKQISDRRDQVLKDAEELYAELSLFESVENECVEKALALESLVKAEKTRKRKNMVSESLASCLAHYQEWMNYSADFLLCNPVIERLQQNQYEKIIKGCSSFTSMQTKLGDQSHDVKTEIDSLGESIIANAEKIDKAGHKQLFIDRKALLMLSSEHLQSEIQGRVARHEAEEVKKQVEAERVQREADEKAEAERLAQELIDNEAAELAAQKANESHDDQAEAIDDGIPDTLPETELVHTELTGVSLTDNEPAQTIDNKPPFGDGPAIHSPVPIVTIPDQKTAPVQQSEIDPVRTLEIVISINAKMERAKQIAGMVHGRFKNLTENSGVSLRDPDKKINGVIDWLSQNGFKEAAQAVVDMKKGGQ